MGSIPDGVTGNFHGRITSSRTMVMGSTRPLTEIGKGKALPLQAIAGPEGSRNLRFLDFLTTAQNGGRFVSLTHRPPLTPGIFLVLIFSRG